MKPLVIDQLYAFVVDNPGVGEGIIGMTMPDGTFLPFVGADMDRVNALRERAQEIATASGRFITVLKFATRTEVEVITP